MKRKILYSAMAMLVGVVTANAQTFKWAKQLGGTSSEFPKSIKVDGDLNVLTGGNFDGTGDFDPGAGAFNLTLSGVRNAYISKLDGVGDFVWAKKLGGDNIVELSSIALDGDGNVYAVGQFNGTADFDPNVGIFEMTSVGGFDIYVCKLDPNGNFLWAKQFGGTGADYGVGIDVDINGNVYTTGSFSGTVDFDPSVGVSNLVSLAFADIFISKLDTDGNFVWAKSISGSFDDYPRSLAIDNSGNVHITGLFNGTMDMDPSAGTYNLTSNGNDIFISKFDASGNFVWANQSGSAGLDQSYSIDIDFDGNVLILGSFEGTVDFDPGVGIVNLMAIGNSDIFVQKLDADGNFLWAKQIGGTDEEFGNSISTDLNGNVYITGEFKQTVDFDPSSGVFNLSALGSSNSDAFICKLDIDGIFAWAFRMGGAGIEVGTSITVDNFDNVYTTGRFNGTANFDPIGGTQVLFPPCCGSNIYIQKLGQCTNTFGLSSQTACGSFTWIDGNTYTANNNTATYNIVGGAVSGCDSIVTLNLTILQPASGIDVQTSCGPFTWIDGNTYSFSTSAVTHTITNGASNGCDSIVTLNLTVTDILATTYLIGTTLSTNQNLATYQWVDCNNSNAPISGATNQSFTPSVSGNYAVEINLNGCTETSSCTQVTIGGGTSSITENDLSTLSLIPNPASTITTIVGLSVGQSLKVIDITGKVVFQTIVNSSTLDFDVTTIENGIYIIQVEQNGAVAQKKLVVSK